MSFFCLLGPSDGGSDYEVVEAHINVWSLPGILKHRPMLFDLGVMFTPTTGLKSIEVALPIRPGRAIDLAGELERRDVAQLVFSQKFAGLGAGTLKLRRTSDGNEEPVKLARIVGDGMEVIDGDSDRELTVLRMRLTAEAPPDQLHYLRARFPVDRAGGLWRWQRVLGRRHGALIDFRAPDPREGKVSDTREAVLQRAKDVPRLEVFFMLPERFQLRTTVPKSDTTRTLEGNAWRPYLRRRPGGLLRREPIMVHQWSREDVTLMKPFRGFMQLNREPGFRAASDVLFTVLLSTALLFALFRPLELRSGLSDVGEVASGLTTTAIGSAVAAAAALGLTTAFLLSRADKLPRALRWVRRKFKQAEYNYYRWFS